MSFRHYACLLLLLCCGCSKHPDPPNVVVIVLDTLRADRLSCYGYERPTTPNLDALAAGSVLYESAYAPSCWTLPSHAAILTGLFPTQAGATSETLQLPAHNTTLAEALRSNGYATGAFVCNTWLSVERGFDQGFHTYLEMWRQQNLPAQQAPGMTVESVAVERLIAWCRQQVDSGGRFFAFANLNGTHLPYRAPEPFASRFVGDRGHAVNDVRRMSDVWTWWAHKTGAVDFSASDYRILGDLYDGEVAFADELVGRVTRALAQMGIMERTMIVVTSDHGEHIGEHGRIDHLLSMYEPALHVPLIVRYPGGGMAGARVEGLVTLTDIAPTIVAACGAEAAVPALDASKTTLVNSERPQRPYLLAANERPVTAIEILQSKYPGYDWVQLDRRLRALRTRSEKVILREGEQVALFDMLVDPGELDDLADERPERRDRLVTLLEASLERLANADGHPLLESTDEESLKHLRSLGYIK